MKNDAEHDLNDFSNIYMRTTWEFSKGVNNQYLLAELWPSVSVT